jgi:Putative beta-barrel porin-2, OmpL-like. bbp2
MPRKLVAALLLVGAAPVAAQESTTTPATTFGGFVDVYYAYNPRSPADRQSWFPGVGTTAKKANELGLNLAAVTVSRAPEPLGFDLVVNAGTATDVVHAGEPEGRDLYRAIYQASLSYRTGLGRGLLVQAGVFPSHIGFEGFFSKDNWNYTRSWLGELSPYYQTGVKLAHPFSDRWSGQLHLLNGWQLIGDNNDGKTVGTQVAYGGDRLSASFNTIYGPELANDDSSMRALADVVVVCEVTPEVSLGGSLDKGRQELPGGPAADWLGWGAYGRYAWSERSAVAVRVERFDDDEGGISGTPQTLREATLTLEHRPHPDLILKLEARADESTARVFKGEDGNTDRQRLLLLGAVATF